MKMWTVFLFSNPHAIYDALKVSDKADTNLSMASVLAINYNNYLYQQISRYMHYTDDCRNNLKKLNRYLKHYNIKQTNHNI